MGSTFSSDSSTTSNPLFESDNCFTASYAALKSRSIDWRQNAVLILQGAELTLWFHANPKDASANDAGTSFADLSKRSYTFSAPLFHHLKALCHLPLTVHAIIAARTDVDATRTDLQNLKDKALTVRKSMDSSEGNQYGLTETQRTRNLTLVDKTIDFIDTLLASPANDQSTLKDSELTSFFREMRPIFSANIRDAAHSCLEALDAKLHEILTESPQSKNLHIVVTGEHMPEEDNMALQYFFAASGRAREGDGVYYAASKYTQEELIHFVAQHLADGVVGARVFGDGDVMHRDLLAPATKDIVTSWKREGRLPIKELVWDQRSEEEMRWKCPFVFQ
ncbi:hypothetical protein DFS34DRAFT_604063 [Phlyctochytrium arcticum]|nr:hypothetical protein DFS34DRAFT_604063 [Phlyctochytrium arcticum]